MRDQALQEQPPRSSNRYGLLKISARSNNALAATLLNDWTNRLSSGDCRYSAIAHGPASCAIALPGALLFPETQRRPEHRAGRRVPGKLDQLRSALPVGQGDHRIGRPEIEPERARRGMAGHDALLWVGGGGAYCTRRGSGQDSGRLLGGGEPCQSSLSRSDGEGDRSRSEGWRGSDGSAIAPPSALRAATSPSLRDREDQDRPVVPPQTEKGARLCVRTPFPWIPPTGWETQITAKQAASGWLSTPTGCFRCRPSRG